MNFNRTLLALVFLLPGIGPLSADELLQDPAHAVTPECAQYEALRSNSEAASD